MPGLKRRDDSEGTIGPELNAAIQELIQMDVLKITKENLGLYTH